VELSNVDKMFSSAAEHLVELKEGTADNISPGSDARDALEILIGIYVADSTSGTVSLPLSDPLRHVTVTSH